MKSIQALIYLLLFIQLPLMAQYATLQSTVDSLIHDGIDSMAYPGAQLLVIHQDSVIIHKAYGHHTYNQNVSVQLDHLYDLASITKVSTGLPVLMKLYDRGLFDLDAPASQYIPLFKKSNKAKLTFREILSHQARLEPYIVFWKDMFKTDGQYKKRTVKSKSSKRYPIRITDQMWLHKKYKKKMQKRIKDSPLLLDKGYKYSGLSFLLMPDMISDMIAADYETQLYQSFYKPLGADRMRYRPRLHFPIADIVPTEKDKYFRNTLIASDVHDEAAAMLDGISCNAGLFGNVESLSKLFHMYMNYGALNGKRYISEKALKLFTSYQYPEQKNRRGLGFDKPLLYYNDDSYIAQSASPESFGHSGFTGTFVWADPTHKILIVFLSNRVYPTRENRKLYTMNIRPKLHQALYDYLIDDINSQ